MNVWGKLEALVDEWRDAGYESDFPVIAEILNHQLDEQGQLTYLRDPQFKALEIYWFLRLKLNTPKFLDLYKQLYEKGSERLKALGIEVGPDFPDFDSVEDYITHHAKLPQHAALAESMQLAYPSYIMALTMGAGKTVLIGTIIATEFAMSLEYGNERYMKNALVFAPGTTIIESLKEISVIPYDKILPARLAKKFLANVKLVYAQTGDKDIQAQAGSSYNIIVTNTEKISLKKRGIKRGQTRMDLENLQRHDELIANQRLSKIASLPSLGIFSDEAHHTYGSKLGEDLKRVRETINHLHNETNLICVVNTTGTPYSGNQTLKDVVFWYSLAQGIEDNILKSLHRSIVTYDFQNTPPDEVFDEVITDFFTKYRDTRLITGQQAKIAFYFKSQAHLDESRPIIERALVKVGESPSLILMNTQQATKKEVEEFNRLNDPSARKRVILLVGKGTEGWNCPSLFATALIRELTSSNNFILQASTRCLRQVEGNNQAATIYIESTNQRTLNNELSKTFGTTLSELNNTEPKTQEINVIFTKTTYPKLEITRTLKRVISGNRPDTPLNLSLPTAQPTATIAREIFTPVLEHSGVMLSNSGEETGFVIDIDTVDIFTAASLIASNYHLQIMDVYTQLEKLYEVDVPRRHLQELFEQVESQSIKYQEIEEQITQALALIKFIDDNGHETFPKDINGTYYHTIRYSPSKEKLITNRDDYAARNNANFGFHYNPYNFDSEPEREFLSEMLVRLQENQADIEDIYFTGGITNPQRTDLHFEYKGQDGRYHKYYPDFVIAKKDGSFLIVEVKAEDEQNDPTVLDKAKAVEQLQGLPGNKFKYHILYTRTPIPSGKIHEVTAKLGALDE